MADRAMYPAGDTRSMGEILRDVAHDIQEMMRAEVRLAKAEIAEKAKAVGHASTMLGAAVICGLLGAAAVVAACIAALATAMPVWAAALIIGFLLLIIAAACFFGGRAKLRDANPKPEQTIDTMKDNLEWAKQRAK